jgi:hypothetical protein
MSSSVEARVAQFAERLAHRDDPAPPDPHRFEPARVLERLQRALQPLTGMRLYKGRLTLARMCYAFLDEKELSSAALQQVAGIGDVAGSRARTRLERAGLLRHYYPGSQRRYRLTRFGEDWLLAVAQDTKPPAPPVVA